LDGGRPVGITEVQGLADIHAAGHRVVHGGELFSESALINAEVLKGIEDCIDLASLHNPNNLKGILAVRQIFGQKLPQVAVFDTAFHHSIPEHAYLYAVPYHLYRRHRIRRYGFHGTSQRYVAYRYRLLRQLNREQTHVITLHLGNGCSAAAIRGGFPVDTSMGMTPLEGLVMGTWSGDLDPAIVNLIATKEGLSAHEVDALLNTQCGLLRISGLTNDMRVLIEELEEHDHRRARLAIEVLLPRAEVHWGLGLFWPAWVVRMRLCSPGASAKTPLRSVVAFAKARMVRFEAGRGETSKRWDQRGKSAATALPCMPMSSPLTKHSLDCGRSTLDLKRRDTQFASTH